MLEQLGLQVNGDDNLNFWMEKRIWLYIEQEWLHLSLIHTHAVSGMVVLNKSD